MPDDDVVVDIVGDRAVEGLDQRDAGGPHDAHCPQTPGAALLQTNARGRGAASLHRAGVVQAERSRLFCEGFSWLERALETAALNKSQRAESQEKSHSTLA